VREQAQEQAQEPVPQTRRLADQYPDEAHQTRA
jgi:hypothetical protein